MPRYIAQTSRRFDKAVERLKARGVSTDLVRHVMSALIEGETLPPERKDHPLKGDLKPYRECHLGGDLVLVYKKFVVVEVLRGGPRGKQKVETRYIRFVHVGRHTDVFEE